MEKKKKLGLCFHKVRTFFSAKVKVLPGMYVYADGLISAELITNRCVKAVVGYVEGKTVYAVCLRQKYLPWCSDWPDVSSTYMISGKEATLRILESAKESGVKVEAAQWCHDYDYDGVVQGEAFLPFSSELDKLSANKEAINKSLRALNASVLDSWYWSSATSGNYGAWRINMGSGYLYEQSRVSYRYYVRPVLAIRL